MKKSTLCILLLFAIISIYGQKETSNQIQIDWGIGLLHRQDLSFSSLIHKPISPLNTQISYQRKGKWTHDVSTRFGLFKKWTVDQYSFYYDEDEESEYTTTNQFVFLDLNYSLSRELFQNENWSIYLGARERNRLQVTDFSAGEGTHFSYYFCFGIDVKTSAELRINEKSKVYSNIYLPLFSHISRPPYSAQDGAYFHDSRSNNPIPTVIEYIKGGRLESWKYSQIFDYDVAYTYQLSDRWEVGAKYLLSMNFNQNPNILNSIENYFYLTTQINF